MEVAENVTTWLQSLRVTVAQHLKDNIKGFKPVDGLQVLLSFPSSGGESVQPEVDGDGAKNPRAGEAKKRFQYVPAVKVGERGKMDEAQAADPILSAVTKKGRIANEGAPMILITPAKHASWDGSAFTGEVPGVNLSKADTREVCERALTLAHAEIFASIIDHPTEYGAKPSKAGGLHIYGEGKPFANLGAYVGFTGKGGWGAQPGLIAFIEKIISENPPPDGAAVNLNPPEKKPSDMKSVTLETDTGLRFAISVRAVRSEKQKKEGKPCAYDAIVGAKFLKFVPPLTGSVEPSGETLETDTPEESDDSDRDE